MAKRYVGVRIDEDVYEVIKSLSDLTGRRISDVIRFLLLFSLSLIAPDTKLRDIIKDEYVKELEKCNPVALDMIVIDVLKVPKQVVKPALLPQ